MVCSPFTWLVLGEQYHAFFFWVIFSSTLRCNISNEEFNELADDVAEELYRGWTPPVGNPMPSNFVEKGLSYGPGYAAGRGRYDTPFWNGYGEDTTVCINGHGCSTQTEVNYFAQGAWGAASGNTLEETLDSIDFWNQDQYGHPATEGEKYWTKSGFEIYKEKEKELERELNND